MPILGKNIPGHYIFTKFRFEERPKKRDPDNIDCTKEYRTELINIETCPNLNIVNI
jgi:hypothetical protein